VNQLVLLHSFCNKTIEMVV